MPFDQSKSSALFAASKEVIPGGVNSPVRSFRSVGGTPPFIARGEGARLYDVDGNSYVDYCLSWGPLILGHAHPEVNAALVDAVQRGTSFGAPTELELLMARAVMRCLPSLEMVRMVNSGTEATMSAIRLARAYTGRNKIIKFIGCYHGHNDNLLVKAGSGATDMGVPDSPGVPSSVAANTISVPFNDLEALEQVFKASGEEIAAIITEPVVGNMGLVLPKPGYLEGLRRITTQYGALLIFDEVMTGWRVSYGGAQGYFGIDPDLTTFGKVIGGGLPVGAYGGKKRIMEMVAPSGPMYQAGTLSGNPLAMTCGLKTLEILGRPGTYERLTSLTERLIGGLNGVMEQLALPYRGKSIGAMFGLFLTDREVWDYDTALTADTKLYSRYFHGLLRRGFFFAPSQFEAGFMSLAHTEADIDATVAAAYESMREALKG
ncbi:MAG TPA: glutamate-1-semialdehyde 2,1-aminomutase [Symbiobacteriaceae bacterium]|nr:glutamate-1-semialdehyde 2,1-aminomutase [Symbiobacteriaceae bacterium]